MRSENDHLKFLDDLARMMTGAMGSFNEVRQQIKGMVRDGVEQMLSEFDMVARDEFSRVEALAEKARERQIELEKRLAALEAKLGLKKAKAKPGPKTKTKTKKTTAPRRSSSKKKG